MCCVRYALTCELHASEVDLSQHWFKLLLYNSCSALITARRNFAAENGGLAHSGDIASCRQLESPSDVNLIEA